VRRDVVDAAVNGAGLDHPARHGPSQHHAVHLVDSILFGDRTGVICLVELRNRLTPMCVVRTFPG
jgi:hypothetical protein